MPGLRQSQDEKFRKLYAQRVNFKYGVRRRAYTVPLTKRKIATTGTVARTYVTLEKKGWLIGAGFRAAGTDVKLGTSDGFTVTTRNGTVLGTCYAPESATIGSGFATMFPFDTGTFWASNKPLFFRIHATNPGKSGSVYFFVDYEPSDKTV